MPYKTRKSSIFWQIGWHLLGGRGELSAQNTHPKTPGVGSSRLPGLVRSKEEYAVGSGWYLGQAHPALFALLKSLLNRLAPVVDPHANRQDSLRCRTAEAKSGHGCNLSSVADYHSRRLASIGLAIES